MSQSNETVNPTTEKLVKALAVLKEIGPDKLSDEALYLRMALPQFLKDNLQEAAAVPYYSLTLGIQLGVALSALALAESEIMKGQE